MMSTIIPSDPTLYWKASADDLSICEILWKSDCADKLHPSELRFVFDHSSDYYYDDFYGIMKAWNVNGTSYSDEAGLAFGNDNDLIIVTSETSFIL